MAHPIRVSRWLRYRGPVLRCGCRVLLAGLLVAGCAGTTSKTRRFEVTATAYNSLPGQTHGHPSIGAWGDTLDPGVPSIAVSRDLLRLGLQRGVRVRVEGFEEEFVVLDKMNKRWKRRIDVHMGKDLEAAKEWGKRKVTIIWTEEP